MRSKWAALLCLASMTISPVLPAMAQEVFVPYEDAGTATYDGSAVYTGAAPIGNAGGYLFFRKDFDNAIGYDDGYSSVGWFQPFEVMGANGFFGQGQIFVTDDGDVGGNLGGGWRTFVDSSNRVFGAYGFLDFDESARGNRHEQITVGVETLGQMWDFRLNGYFPLDDDAQFEGLRTLGTSPTFQGNNLVVLGTAFFEKPMPGADVEWGFPILDPSAFGRLRSYFGGYVYDAEDKNPAGVRVRLESHVNEHVTLGAAFYHDDVNGGMATASLDIRGWSRSLPGINNKTPSNEAKLYLPVVRNYRIAAETYVDDFSAVALDGNGNELDFVWVNNGNAAPGNGTFEDPFHDMPANAPGADYILVWRGPSSPANPVLGGITLEDEQRLYGEGFEFFIDVSGTKFGAMPGVFSIKDIVPTWSIQGDGPFLSNPAGDVITLANNNHVRSFQIVSSGGHGITGTGIDDFLLEDLIIGNANPGFGNAGAGIFLTDASGTGVVNNFELRNNAGGGVIVRNTNTAQLDLLLNASTVNPGYNVVGGQFGLNLEADNSIINADVNDYRNNASGEGMVLRAANGGTLNVDVDTGSFDNTTVGDGILVEATDSTVNLALLDTTAVNATGNGFNIDLVNSIFTGDVQSTGLGDSSFSGAGLNGVRLFADSSPSLANFLHFINTTVDNSGQALDPVDNDGLHIILANGSFFDVDFRNGSIQNSGGSAVFEDISGGSTLDILINPSNLSGSGETGVRIIADDSTIIHRIFDTTINGSGDALIANAGHGIHATLTGGALVEFNMSNSSVNQSNEHGLFIEASDGSVFTTPINLAATPPLNGIFNTTFNDSNLSGGAFDGIHVVAINPLTDVTLLLSDVQAQNTTGGPGLQQNALDFSVDDSATFTFTVTNAAFGIDSSFSNSEEDGVLGFVTGGGIANVSFSGTTIDNSGRSGAGSGMNLTVEDVSELNVSVTDGSITGSADHGVIFDAQDAGTIASLLIDNTPVDDNGADGVNLNAGTGAAMTADIVNGSSVSNNAQNGIIAAADGPGTTLDLTVEDSTVDDNQGGDGINLMVSDTAELNATVTGTSVSGNDDDGISLTSLGGANGGATSTLTIEESTIDNNVNGYGIDVNLSDLTDPTGAHISTITLIDSSASGNDQDGFRLQASGSATDVTLHAGFDPLDPLNTNIPGLDADNNGGNGWNLQIHDAAMLTAMINNSSGSGNGINGFLLEATGNQTIVVLDTTGGNQFDDNVNGYGALVNATGIAELTAVVGGGSNNGLGGVEINVDAQNVTIVRNVGVVGSNINDNTGHGVLINIDDSPEVRRVTVASSTINANSGRGVWIDIDNSLVDDLTTVALDGHIFVDGNLIDGNTGGEGILIDLFMTPVDGMIEVSNNGISNNASHGLNFELNGSPIDTLNIHDNNTGAGIQTGLAFLIDGNTFAQPWVITNTSQAGVDITGFMIDLAPTIALNPPGFVWDSLAPGAPVPFQPLFNSDVTTGLVSVNGNLVTPGTNPLQDNLGAVLPGGGVPDDGTLIDLVFNDFNSGEIFTWDLDVDVTGAGASTVTGDDLIGSDITVFFTGGLFIAGTLQAVLGNPDASQFVATSGNIGAGGIGGNGGDGIRINQTNGSNIANLNISNNRIEENDAHGIEFLVSNSTLPGPGSAATITQNEITGNGQAGVGDGIRLVNPNTGGVPIAIDFTENTITGNLNGAGINIQLNNLIEDDGVVDATADFIANFTDNTISNNGGPGVSITTPILPTANALTLDLDFTGNTMDANTDAGIALVAGGSSRTDLQLNDNVITGTVNGPNPNLNGDGVNIRLFDLARLDNFAADGNTFGEVGNGNAGRGLFIRMTQDTVSTGHLITNNTISGNNQGLVYHRFADAILDDVTIAGNTIEGNEQQGIDLMMDGDGALIIDFLIGGPTAADRNMIIGNGASGIRAAATANVELNLDIQNNEISDNELDGIQASAAFFAALTGTWSQNTMNGNDQDAIRMTLTQAGFMDVTIGGLTPADGNIISNSGRHGVSLFASNYASDSSTAMVAILNNDISLSETDGIHVNATGVVPATLDRTLVGVVVDNNDVFTSGRDGLHLEQHGFSQIVATADMNQFSGNGRDGAHFFADGGSDPDVEFPLTITELDVTLTNSRMENNERNGMFVNAAGDADVEVVATDNFYRFNDGRGIHVLNTGNADMVVEINGTVNPVPGMGVNPVNLVEDNGLQGILVENAAGVGGTDNDLDIYVTNTTIRGNGQLAVNPDDGNGLYLRAGTSSTGDMDAIIENNWFAGNLNIDFVTESFVSAPAPGVGGPDPLARLDLRLRGNSMDEADVTRIGAFYNNADAIQSQNSVFTSSTRQRNAQRLPADVFVDVGQVAAAPAPTTTAFADDGTLGSAAAGFYVNNLLTFLNGANVGASRTVSAYTAARLITVSAAFGAAPVDGDDFRLDALGQAGLGASTFRAEDASVLTNNTIRDTLISDFGTAIPLPGGSGLRAGFVFDTTFTWQAPVILPNPPFTP